MNSMFLDDSDEYDPEPVAKCKTFQTKFIRENQITGHCKQKAPQNASNLVKVNGPSKLFAQNAK